MPASTTDPAAPVPAKRLRPSRREVGIAALVWGVYALLGWAS